MKNASGVPMTATERLRAEHKRIEAALGILDILALNVERGSRSAAELMVKAAAFFRDFADARHHEKEEGLLFPAMARNGFPLEMGPLRIMIMDHEAGRKLVADFEAQARRLLDGDPESGPAAARSALAFSEHLRQHIFKENNILFPLADQALSSQDQEELSALFRRAEEQGGTVARLESWDEAVQSLNPVQVPS